MKSSLKDTNGVIIKDGDIISFLNLHRDRALYDEAITCGLVRYSKKDSEFVVEFPDTNGIKACFLKDIENRDIFVLDNICNCGDLNC